MPDLLRHAPQQYPYVGSVMIDKVRASREGHTYHDCWTARVALELLVPATTLTAIAVEGFSTEDTPIASAAATEVADLVRYRGGVKLEGASGVEVVQFKYSIAQASDAMSASDIGPTLAKFARAETDFLAAAGSARVERVVRYELVTNRPIGGALLGALNGIRSGQPLTGDLARQADTISAACALPPPTLLTFLSRVTLSGRNPDASALRASVHRTIANWGAAPDTFSRLWLANLCHLCREKAGASGQHNNLIQRVDVLAALEVPHESDLFPTPGSFAEVRDIIQRPILDNLVSTIDAAGLPILLHSPGGMGKTVLMQALAQRYDTAAHAVVLFDCYGAGQWRNPVDGRHEVQRALPHIANLLAGRGLCDVLLPRGATIDLARAFRARLAQAVEALRQSDSGGRILLLLDAIDHSALQAAATHTDAFSQVLLKSLSIEPIDGVAVVASCRTERRDIARSGAECREVPIQPFSLGETVTFVRLRDNKATAVEVAALHTRSGGNPRILDALLRKGRPYDDSPGTAQALPRTDLLDDLLQRQIDDARREATARGLLEAEVNALLAGLALLPPPVPLVELAAAHGRPEPAIESFAADLFPLIERTSHGLIFRDEPTETLIRRLFTTDEASLKTVIERLHSRQVTSTYAARALPIVLTSLRRTRDLVALAFDSRLPASAVSRVAQRAIRLSRLTSALRACAAEKRSDDLTELLLETARVAGGHNRSDRFLLAHPDLVGISGDPEAVRRLFEVRCGWPGSRHAAMAVVHALSGEMGEARRNAHRAFGWLNWRSQQPERHDGVPREGSSEDLDLTGPAYVETLAGNATRVGVWLDAWPEHYSYRLYADLARLLERHADLSVAARANRDEVVHRAARSRSKSRAIAAALLQNVDLSPAQAERQIRRLAAISASSGPVPDEWDYGRRTSGLADALVAAAMRAVHLGLDAEAQAILDRIGIRRLRVSEFDTFISSPEPIARSILGAAVRAAVDRREPSLMDIAPEEVHAALHLRKHNATPAEYDAAVQRLLAEPSEAPRLSRRKRKKTLGYRQREEVARTLEHRVRPLLSVASAVAQLLRTHDTHSAVTGVLDRLAELSSAANTYPYRDGPHYIAKAAFRAVAMVTDALGVLSAAQADRLVNWLTNSPLQHTGVWIDTISLLSRRRDTRAAAEALAARAATLIRSDTDTGSRVKAYGALARAIWRSSRAEAQAYFRRGLDVADAVGSDDADTATNLIAFAANYVGAPLPAKLVDAFTRICELAAYDEDKFPWSNFAKATARLAGPQAIAIVARLADREKCSLSLSLPPLLTTLVAESKLDADLAVGLLGIDELVQTWSWDVSGFAEVALARIRPAAREPALRILLAELDRRYQASPPPETLNRLVALFEREVSPDSPAMAQLVALRNAERVRDSPATGEGAQPTPVIRETTPSRLEIDGPITLLDGAAIDAALAAEDSEAVGRPLVRLMSPVWQRLASVDDRCRILRGIADAGLPSLADKLLAIEDHIGEWQRDSAAIRDLVPRLGLELSARHAEELVGSDWTSSYALRKLVQFSQRPAHEVVSSVISALGSRAVEVAGAAWMELACVMAPNTTSGSICAALERFITASEIPEDAGEGPWRRDREAPAETFDIVAGLVWQRLGSPRAAQRWRAAHSVRRLAAFGRTDVLQALALRFWKEDAGAFQDRRLPFFFLHARLWLLIAVARLAQESPASILPLRSVLEGVAFDNSMPHVGMQYFAAQALLSLLGSGPATDASALRAALKRINASRFPRSEAAEARRTFYHSRAGGSASDSEPFHFDYDFAKDEIDHLAGIFGADFDAVAESTTTRLRRWCKDVKSMWDCPRHPGAEYERWSEPRGTRSDTWGGHLAEHALMVTAGELLQRRPLVAGDFGEDRWERWLQGRTLSRSDGLWLSDGTDSFPPDLYARRVSLRTDEDVPADPCALSWLVGLTERHTLAEHLTIGGSWTSSDGLDVNVDSVVVDASLARSVALAILTVDPFDQWLPKEDDFWRQGRRGRALRRLFRQSRYAESGLDSHDPYAAPTASSRPILSGVATRLLRLRAPDAFRRSWQDRMNIEIARASAWGTQPSSSRDDRDKTGRRLILRSEALLTLLSLINKRLVLLVKAQRYVKDGGEKVQRRTRRMRAGPFRTRTLVLLVSSEGRIEMIRRVPQIVRKAVTQMKDERYDFYARLKRVAGELRVIEQMRSPHH